MTDLSSYVGVIGNITWILLFLSPAYTFYWIVRNRSTENFESVPYICTLLDSALWTYYGITKPNLIFVATVNVFGIVVETIYLILFLIYAPPEVKAKTMGHIVSIDVLFFGVVVWVAEMDEIGLLAAVFNIITYIIMYGPPLPDSQPGRSRQGMEYMPFFLPLFCFLNGGVWTFYAILVKDIFVGVPNAIGFIIATVQLVRYYDRRNSNETNESLLA